MAEGNGKSGQHSKCGNGASLNCHTEYFNARRNEFYDMNHKYRGKALIFSHDHYDIDLLPRAGSPKDCENLDKCLKQLAFSVDIYPNLKYAEIMKHIEQTAKMNHSKNDCLLIVVLTHGESGVLYAKDTHYRSENLWSRFTDENCPTLAGKPKLFVFQACQGEDYDDGITLQSDIETDGFFEPNTIPLHPDFLLALSTVPGYFAWRNTDCGSWFIQALCKELLKDSATELDILTILTFVNQNVALNYASNTTNIASSNKKEVPCFSSMLTRRLVFTKKPDSSNNKKSFLGYFKECSINKN